jgi:hypothetical protein
MPHRPEDELFEGHSTVNFGIDGGEPGFLVPDRRPCRVHAQLDRKPIILVHGHQERVSIAIEGALTQRRSDLFSRGGNRLLALHGSLIRGSPSAPAGLRMSFRSPGHEFQSVSTLEGAARSTVHRSRGARLFAHLGDGVLQLLERDPGLAAKRLASFLRRLVCGFNASCSPAFARDRRAPGASTGAKNRRQKSPRHGDLNPANFRGKFSYFGFTGRPRPSLPNNSPLARRTKLRGTLLRSTARRVWRCASRPRGRRCSARRSP